jgi:predicted nucleic acid-binding protein
LELILDSSVTIAWFMPEEDTGETRKLLDRVTEDGALVPIHWSLEVGNALLVAFRGRRIPVERRREALLQLLKLQITTDRQTLDEAWSTTLTLADRFRLTLYDAAYLELAQRRDLPLATLDKDLRKAAKALDIALLGV